MTHTFAQIRPEQWLVVIFGDVLMIGLAPKSLSSRFTCDGVQFASIDENHLTAFFDRLLDSAQRLVGIHVTPIAESARQFFDALPAAPYLTGGRDGCDIWLSGEPIAQAQPAADQAFGGQLFRSGIGSYAMSLDADFLLASAADYEALRSANARWVEVVY
jgi:hypothetical protein